MLRLRGNLLLLILYIGIVLNIERLDFGSIENVINLASFVYVLLGTAILSVILLPKKWKLSTRTITLFWVAVYLALKVTVGSNHAMIGGFYTYITLVEVFILVVLVIQGQAVMDDLTALEETIANITLADVSNRVVSLDAADQTVNREFARGRRYNRPIGVVVIKLTPQNIQANVDKLSKDILMTMLSRYSMSNLIRAIDKEIRRPDLIIEQHKENRIILLLPEANSEVAETISKKIREIAKTYIGSQVAIGMATFPNDALVFEDLILRAESAIDAMPSSDFDDLKHEDSEIELTDIVSPK